MNGYKCRCGKRVESEGEKRISGYLTSKNIKFIKQHSFPGCEYERPLKFDFYLPELNLCIEYDGEQHFEPVEVFGGMEAFIKTQTRDKIKNDYCLKNKINLLRIPYYTLNFLEDLLDLFLSRFL